MDQCENCGSVTECSAFYHPWFKAGAELLCDECHAMAEVHAGHVEWDVLLGTMEEDAYPGGAVRFAGHPVDGPEVES